MNFTARVWLAVRYGLCIPPLHDKYLQQIFPAGQWLLSLSRSCNLGANVRSGQINKAAVPSWAAPLIPGPGLLHTRALRSLLGRPMSLSADRCFNPAKKQRGCWVKYQSIKFFSTFPQLFLLILPPIQYVQVAQHSLRHIQTPAAQIVKKKQDDDYELPLHSTNMITVSMCVTWVRINSCTALKSVCF